MFYPPRYHTDVDLAIVNKAAQDLFDRSGTAHTISPSYNKCFNRPTPSAVVSRQPWSSAVPNAQRRQPSAVAVSRRRRRRQPSVVVVVVVSRRRQPPLAVVSRRQPSAVSCPRAPAATTADDDDDGPRAQRRGPRTTTVTKFSNAVQMDPPPLRLTFSSVQVGRPDGGTLSTRARGRVVFL